MNLGRIIVPVITPFKGDTSIDYKKFSNLLKETCREDFTDSIIIMATTGEFASMTFEERKSLIKCAREAVSNKPLIVGTSAVTTGETVKLTKAAEEIGADVALIMQPYYYRPSQEEIYEYFKTIAESTNIPILIYNLLITGVNISPAITVKLAHYDNIIAVKEIGSNFFQTAQVINGLREENIEEKLQIYAGSAKLSLPLLTQGAIGVVTEGLIGKEVKEIIQNYFQGNVRKATDIYLKNIIPYFGIFGFCGVVPGIKHMLNLQGYEIGIPRAPLKELSEEQKTFVKSKMKELGLLT